MRLSGRQILGIAIIVIVAGYLVYLLVGALGSANDEIIETGNQAIVSTITYKGHEYYYNTDLTNILFLGIDNEDTLGEWTGAEYAGQSDAIFLLTLNNATHEVTVLQINRNSMTELDVFNIGGQITETINGQVTLQYAFGTGGMQSAWATKRTVSEMLCGLNIDSYFVMNISGIAIVNDSIGGVDVTMPVDYTSIDASMTEGSSVHLTGDAAVRFVRYRDLNEFNSVEDRMRRQVLYITAMLDKLCSQGTANMYESIEPYLGNQILTDMDVSDFDRLPAFDYLNCQINLLPGQTVMGDRYEEFYIDSEALEEYIINNYYIRAD